MAVVKARANDIDLLARLLRAEAEGEGEQGMMLVGNVGINRIRANCSDFKGLRTIPQMIYQPHAFEAVRETARNGWRNGRLTGSGAGRASSACGTSDRRAIARLRGTISLLSAGLSCTASTSPSRANAIIFTIRSSYRQGSRPAGMPPLLTRAAFLRPHAAGGREVGRS
ncbi:MAG: cell wall hydrolase [Paenibacillus sp.]|nr:cell wall hydrolase [Paenibacillus sp.]